MSFVAYFNDVVNALWMFANVADINTTSLNCKTICTDFLIHQFLPFLLIASYGITMTTLARCYTHALSLRRASTARGRS